MNQTCKRTKETTNFGSNEIQAKTSSDHDLFHKNIPPDPKGIDLNHVDHVSSSKTPPNSAETSPVTLDHIFLTEILSKLPEAFANALKLATKDNNLVEGDSNFCKIVDLVNVYEELKATQHDLQQESNEDKGGHGSRHKIH